MMTTVLCYSATLGANVTDYGTPFRVDMGNVVSDHAESTRNLFMGGLAASMYFFAVSRWMPSSRAIPRIDNPLRFAF